MFVWSVLSFHLYFGSRDDSEVVNQRQDLCPLSHLADFRTMVDPLSHKKVTHLLTRCFICVLVGKICLKLIITLTHRKPVYCHFNKMF